MNSFSGFASRSKTWIEKYNKTKLNRNDAVEIVENIENLLQIYENQLKSTDDRSADFKFSELSWLWNRWRSFFIVLSQDTIIMNDLDSWNLMTNRWTQRYVKFFELSEFTSYIHIFHMHSGELLQMHGGLQKLGNFSIEAHHQLNRLEYHQHTDRQGNCAFQSLCALVYEDFCNIQIPNSQFKKTWTSKFIDELDEDLAAFLPKPK